MIKLAEAHVSGMLAQPESGMGYQNVEVKCTTGIRKGTVYNGELLLWEEEPRTFLVEGVYQRLVKTADSIEGRMIESIRVVRPTAPSRPPTVTEKFAERMLGKPASEGEPKKTKAGEVFMRFTAYIKDRRITSDKGLLPGTYATTEADSRHVKTGAEAVERYALPDPKPAKYRYRIDPLKDTVYREGIVQPANEHKGGGVEVIFDKGTDKHTVSGPDILPEK